MKLETKKISLIIVTAMCLFSGIFVLAEAGVHETEQFDKIVIKNAINYDVKLSVQSSVEVKIPGDDEQKHASKDFSMNAGESKEFPKGDLLGGVRKIWINPITDNQNLIFHQGKNLWKLGSALTKVSVSEENQVLGDFTVLVRTAERILHITIDSNDEDLQYESGDELCQDDELSEAQIDAVNEVLCECMNEPLDEDDMLSEAELDAVNDAVNEVDGSE